MEVEAGRGGICGRSQNWHVVAGIRPPSAQTLGFTLDVSQDCESSCKGWERDEGLGWTPVTRDNQ